MRNKSILVIFGKGLPQKKRKWWHQFDRVIGPRGLEEKVQSMNLSFVALEDLIDPGSVQEAHELANDLSRLALPDGRSLPKLITYKGYELWWIHYEDLMLKFCLPYTQYRRLLVYLKSFSKTYLFQLTHPAVFQYFLSAHNCESVILQSRLKKFLPIPFGVLVQVFLSLPFLLWLKVTRPKLMLRTSDQFAPPHNCDFRMMHIYEELRNRKIPFVEFIRSQERLLTVLKHAWIRKRPVVYSTAIIMLLYKISRWLGREKKFANLCLSTKFEPEQCFWYSVATVYLNNFQGTIWAIQMMKFILKWIGVRAGIVIAGSSRTFHEILACKLAGIKTVGIQHGAVPRYYGVAEFMSDFDGELMLTPDMYGLWSNWWKEYFISYSRAYQPQQLYVSGHMRPLPGIREISLPGREKERGGPIKVLFVSEQLAAPSEVLPYLLSLLEAEDISVFLKFRPYRDGFEEWLKENHPELLEKGKILRGSMHDAISQVDVVIGSHSTGVLEASLQFKPFVFFQTGKWGDYFEMRAFSSQHRFFAKTPEELVEIVRESNLIPKEILAKIQNQFFGDPYQNGSKWVVDQAIKFLAS